MIVGIAAGQAAGTSGPSLPTTIGEAFGGGYYIGDITIPSGVDAGDYAIIMAGSAAEANKSWKFVNSDTPGTSSTVDGMANTEAMLSDANHYAGIYCHDLTFGGHSDWYMPAQNELNLAWINRAVLGDLTINKYTWYWSSTQSSAANGLAQEFDSGSTTGIGKYNAYKVRPVRRLKIS